MIKSEFDKKQPLYHNCNERVHGQLIVDRLSLTLYESDVLHRLTTHRMLLRARERLIERFEKSPMFAKNYETLNEHIQKVKRDLFFILEASDNPYLYLLAPYYLYGEGKKHVVDKSISNTHGYQHIFGTGLVNTDIAAEFGLYMLGVLKFDIKTQDNIAPQRDQWGNLFNQMVAYDY